MERCANCNGTLKLSPDQKKLICEYCDSEFIINKTDTHDAVSDSSEVCLALQLLDTSAVKSFDNDHNLKSFQEMCAWINAGDTVETCVEGLRNLATRHTDWAMDGFNDNLLNKVKRQLDGFISTEERILFFKDSGIIATGKSGVLITDKNIFCFNKKHTLKLPVKDICSIHMLALLLDNGEWYFNANKELKVDNIACSPIEQGVIMALICLLVKEQQEHGYKIKVYKGVL